MDFYKNSDRHSNTIISCGGGVVENSCLLQVLKSFKLVVFINRDISDIKILNDYKFNNQNRPNYQFQTFEEVYLSRLSKYKYCSNYIFDIPTLGDKLQNKESSLIPISNMFINFISLISSPMKYPIPFDPSYFVCFLLDENTEDTLEIHKSILEDYKKDYSCIEVRADLLIENLWNTMDFGTLINKITSLIAKIKFITQIPILFTIRSKCQGGYFTQDLKIYNRIYKEIIKRGVEFIDLEYNESNLSFIESLCSSDRNYRVIFSNHFITEIPLDNMKKISFTMSNLRADIIKIISSISDRQSYDNFYMFLRNIIK